MDFLQSDDLTLLHEIKNGNELAFNEMFRRYSRFLKIQAYYKLKDTQLAEEAVNDVLISIWQRRNNIEINIPLKAYLFKAITKQCAYKERSLRQHRLLVNHVDVMETDFGFYPATLENKELGQKILNAIAHISAPSSRRAFEMQYIYHKPQKEIAQEMNMSLDAVKKKISRATQEVRSLLKKSH
ncbi:sigma-70 family RNA polymerase sigma factor [Chitinophaga sp. SYP-B3965]|uniref:RNA polymerase sigma factor n=1 Tax=Chitinophaga sp. SYP-B3965 TaxID=2663120 RepID=UPI001299CE86|nr:sigma-70 family RNA polymerase sigma factor [Chitinophaga sp. SYP-B3965]MRG49019.1 sigma-70 family RNA polymerase sigma factor [Chitinophaga sp. SYP-B3965]